MAANPRCFMDITANGDGLGRIVVELRADLEPRAAEKFRAHCTGENGFHYEGSLFHHIIPGFICQGGAMNGAEVADENFVLRHGFGILTGEANAQFFLCTVELDGNPHVVFGTVTPDSMMVVQRVESFGNPAGRTSKTIIVAKCGQLD